MDANTKHEASRIGAALTAETDGVGAEAAIIRDIVQRKAQKGVSTKAQPWKSTYVVAPEDLPKSYDILHDTPWFDDPHEYPACDSGIVA